MEKAGEIASVSLLRTFLSFAFFFFNFHFYTLCFPSLLMLFVFKVQKGT